MKVDRPALGGGSRGHRDRRRVVVADGDAGGLDGEAARLGRRPRHRHGLVALDESSSSVGSRSKVAVPVFEPAAMVRVKSVTAAKSVPFRGGAAADRDGDRRRRLEGHPALQGPGHGDLGCVPAAFSATDAGKTRLSVTLVGAASSSVMVPVAEARQSPARLTPAGRPPDGTARVTVKVSSPSTRMSPVVVT